MPRIAPRAIIVWVRPTGRLDAVGTELGVILSISRINRKILLGFKVQRQLHRSFM